MILASSTLAWSQPISKVITRIAELGLSGIEVWAEHLWRTKESAEELRRSAEKLGLHRTVHGPSWDLNLCSIDEVMLRASRRCTLRSVDLAADLGADVLVVHPGRESLGGHFRDYHWRELKKSYAEICAHAAEKEVRIALEAMEQIPKEFLCHAETVNRFVDELQSDGAGNIGVTVDLAHLTTVSSNIMAYLGTYASVIEIHISNVNSVKLHTPLSEGYLNFTEIIPMLQHDYRVPIVIEGLSDQEGFLLLDRNAQAALRSIE